MFAVALRLSHQTASNAKMPNTHNDQQMQQLVEAVKHPVRFLFHIHQFLDAGGEAAFGSVDEIMRNKFREHEEQQEFPRHAKNQQTHSHQ